MKLITEYLPNTTEVITEEAKDGKKKMYIEGIFMQAAKKNRNGRLYPTPVLEAAVNKYIEEEVDTNGAIGELNHPKSPIPDPANASHRIVELRKEGDDFYGKALLLDTAMGIHVQKLLEGDVRLGVSSRGLGTIKEVKGVNEVQNDFQLKTVDIVHNPSAPDAFVNGIMEGVEYLTDGSILDQNHVDRIEQEIKEASAADLQEVKIRVFNEAMMLMSGQPTLCYPMSEVAEGIWQKQWLKKALKDPVAIEKDIRAMIEMTSRGMAKASKSAKPVYQSQIDSLNRLLTSVTTAQES